MGSRCRKSVSSMTVLLCAGLGDQRRDCVHMQTDVCKHTVYIHICTKKYSEGNFPKDPGGDLKAQGNILVG